ncbi:DUF4184 family protein [Nocardia sp. NPDC051833]|uniref:DUF4184 family protein n=1 Tax=Nocardia sp. NPDC051833 TaxID=3155674 RepID=UPI00342DCF32
MPITLAHPVAVLPLARRLPLSALVAGAIAPDVVYYLPIPLGGAATHSLVGVLSWDLVIGVGLLLCFRLSAGPAAALFPFRIALPARVPADGLRRLWVPVVAIALGALTHLAWDSCTQTAGFVVRHWPLLRAPVVGPHTVYNVIGYASSLLGTAALAHYLVRRTSRRSSAPPVRWGRAIRTGLILAPVLGAVLAIDDPVTRASSYDLVRHTIVGAAQGLGCAWTLYVLLWQIRGFGSSRRPDTAESQGDHEGQRRDDGGGAERGGHPADEGVRR